MLAARWEFLIAKRENARPAQPLPLVATDLASLSPQQDTLVWLGHSSWYLQLAGQRILIDPVLSNYAAPFSFLNKAFAGEYPWTAQTMPEIDLLIISHDHYDHLDLATIKALMPKIKRVITPLGVGSHLRYWGMNSEIIEECDWNQSVKVTDSLIVHVLPARHFSGRGLNVTKRCGPVSCLKRRNRTFTTAATPATGRILKRLASSLARSIWQSWKMVSMTGLEVHSYDAGRNRPCRGRSARESGITRTCGSLRSGKTHGMILQKTGTCQSPPTLPIADADAG